MNEMYGQFKCKCGYTSAGVLGSNCPYCEPDKLTLFVGKDALEILKQHPEYKKVDDKQESWEEHWKSKIRSILLDEELSLNGRHNRIMEVVEAEKKKAEARGFNTLLATSGCYSFEQTKQLIETEKKKLAMDISKDIEIRLNIKHKTYDEIKRCVLEGWQRT